MDNQVAIVGVGNPFRGDDGAGWELIDMLKDKLSSLALFKSRGDIAELIDIFGSYSTVFIVDACETSLPVGNWKRFDMKKDPFLLDHPQTSTHGLSLKEAISLAKTLNVYPENLIIYAISGKDFQMKSELSQPVKEALKNVAKSLLTEKEITSCMKKA